MKYMGDSAFWNGRFRDMERSLREPDPCLQEEVDCFADCERILDLACGDGRNSIFLARLGKEITAVDFSEEALLRLNHYAAQEGLSVKTRQMDLSSDEILTLKGSFDGIIINHYRLDPRYFPHVLSLLKDGGLLWVNGFRETPTDSSVITEADVLSPSDFSTLSSCSLLNRLEHEANQRKFVRYLWKKKILPSILRDGGLFSSTKFSTVLIIFKYCSFLGIVFHTVVCYNQYEE